MANEPDGLEQVRRKIEEQRSVERGLTPELNKLSGPDIKYSLKNRDGGFYGHLFGGQKGKSIAGGQDGRFGDFKKFTGVKHLK